MSAIDDSNGTRLDPGLPDAASRNAGGWLAGLRARLGLGSAPTLRDTVEEALRSPDQTGTAFSEAERDMLLRLLRFGNLSVEDVMVPRADIIAVDETATLSELLAIFQSAGVSRIPLFHETLDDPRGMVHVKDLMRHLTAGAAGNDTSASNGESAPAASGATFDLARADLSRSIQSTRLRRQVLYVPPSMPAVNLLIRMQSTRIHMALVVDEYGGTDGLVTIEDLVEQVVGDIEDEHDVAEAANIIDDARQGLLAQARTPIDELEHHLGVKLLKPGEESEIDTLGGLVFTLVGRVPVRGEVIRHESGIEFEVVDADLRRVKRVRIHRPSTVAGTLAQDEEAAPTPRTATG